MKSHEPCGCADARCVVCGHGLCAVAALYFTPTATMNKHPSRVYFEGANPESFLKVGSSLEYALAVLLNLRRGLAPPPFSSVPAPGPAVVDSGYPKRCCNDSISVARTMVRGSRALSCLARSRRTPARTRAARGKVSHDRSSAEISFFCHASSNSVACLPTNSARELTARRTD